MGLMQVPQTIQNTNRLHAILTQNLPASYLLRYCAATAGTCGRQSAQCIVAESAANAAQATLGKLTNLQGKSLDIIDLQPRTGVGLLEILKLLHTKCARIRSVRAFGANEDMNFIMSIVFGKAKVNFSSLEGEFPRVSKYLQVLIQQSEQFSGKIEIVPNGDYTRAESAELVIGLQMPHMIFTPVDRKTEQKWYGENRDIAGHIANLVKNDGHLLLTGSTVTFADPQPDSNQPSSYLQLQFTKSFIENLTAEIFSEFGVQAKAIFPLLDKDWMLNLFCSLHLTKSKDALKMPNLFGSLNLIKSKDAGIVLKKIKKETALEFAYMSGPVTWRMFSDRALSHLKPDEIMTFIYNVLQQTIDDYGVYLSAVIESDVTFATLLKKIS